jgi:hypothetical protein
MMFPNAATRVLLAVVSQPRATVRSVAEEVGCAISTAHSWLRVLRDEGLVAWTEGEQGTLRSTCGFVCPNGRSFATITSGSQHRVNGAGPLDTTAPSKRRDHARR